MTATAFGGWLGRRLVNLLMIWLGATFGLWKGFLISLAMHALVRGGYWAAGREARTLEETP